MDFDRCLFGFAKQGNYQQDGHASVELNMKNVLKPFKEAAYDRARS